MGLKIRPVTLGPRRILTRGTGVNRRIVIRPAASGGGGGVSDHGGLTGLGDDDHGQYALADGTRGDFATTAQGDLADTAVQPSALSDAITAHTAATDPHGDRAYTDAQIIASLANFVAGAPGILDTWLEMVTAIQADQTGLAALTTVVAGKLAKASNLSDLADIPTARTNLGLGSAATTAASAYDAAGAAAAAQAAAIAAAATDATTKADAKVADAINDGTTTVAPSQNAVYDALATKADLASPALTGNPTAPTQTVGDNSTRIATTAFVAAAAALKMSTASAPLIRLPAPTRLSATGGMVGGLLVPVVGSSTHNIPVGYEFLGRCHHSGQTAVWLGFNVSANALTAGQSIIIAVYANAPDNGPGILLSSQSLVVGTTTGDLIFSSGVSLTFPVGACYVSVINPSTNAGTITIRSGTFYSPHFGVVQNGTWGGPMKRTGVTAPASDLSSIQLRSSIGSNEINVDAGTTFPVLLGRTA